MKKQNKPKPCPFCKTIPEFGPVEHMYGTQFEWDCEGCSFSSVSLQLDHHFLEDDLKITDYTWTDYQLDLETRLAIISYVTDEWNKTL